MNNSTFDYSALLIAVAIALVITAALSTAYRRENRKRLWIVAGLLTAALVGIGLIDLLRASPRETHIATVIVAPMLSVLGALGMIRGTRGVRARIRLPVVFLTALSLFFAGLLIGATLVPRWFS